MRFFEIKWRSASQLIHGAKLNYLQDNSQKQDPVRPGEQWFFYWKTSAALWENRILEFPQHEVIFIPLYWGFHADSASTWDFGEIQPEKDLRRLTQLLLQHNRSFCWILPLTPAPFLPNGGVPAQGARTLSLSREGVHLAVLDHEEKLNKMFSFFDPKVFGAFNDFLENFSSFLFRHHIKAPLWGMEFSYLESGAVVSYIEDTSLAFEKGFSRYLKKNFPEGIDLTQTNEEEKLKARFIDEASGLFKGTAENILGPFWQGSILTVALGGSPRETIERSLTDGKNQYKFFDDLFNLHVKGYWISSALLLPEEKKELMPKLLSEHFGGQEIDQKFRYKTSNREFRPFGLIDLYTHAALPGFEKTGLIGYLFQNYRWMYQVHSELVLTRESFDRDQEKIKIFHGLGMDRTRFGQMLKLFLMGQKIILDKTNLDPELEKRLQVFYMENNLKVQSINFQTLMTITDLGEGKFVTYEGDKIKEGSESFKFWNHLFTFLGLTHPEVQLEKDVFSLWRIRDVSSQDLNFLDVRRVNFYNPTSYKKKITIKTKKHFALMRTIDPLKAEARSTTEGVEVDLLPFGRIALDFGHYEEL